MRANRLVSAPSSNRALEDEFWRYTDTDENSDRVGEFAIGTNIALDQRYRTDPPAQLAASPGPRRSQYILQQRLEFEPVIETPCGPAKVEVRIMFMWLDELEPGAILLRLERGSLMGVDYNRNMDWVGSSAAFYPAE